MLVPAFILHREIVLTMKSDFTLRAYLRLTSRVCAMMNKTVSICLQRPRQLKCVVTHRL